MVTACQLPLADSSAIAGAAAMVNGFQRSLLDLGGGVMRSGTATAAVNLAEKANLPTVITLMARGAMPVDLPLSLGMHGARAAIRHSTSATC